jgi:hypothetical protein
MKKGEFRAGFALALQQLILYKRGLDRHPGRLAFADAGRNTTMP